MGYGLGVDLGTTYTAAAVRRDGRIDVVPLGSRRPEIPSLVYVQADGAVLVGEAAERRGGTDPGRLAREFKRRVGDPVAVLVGGRPYSAQALMARLLEHVLQTVAAQQGGPPDAVTVTHPANWGPFKRDLLEQAVRMAGLSGVRMCSEPEAAAIAYAAGERVGVGEVVAVYDLGGGTFDAAVLRKTEDGFELLGPPEGIEHLGGIDFDEAVFGHVMAALGEAATRLDPDDEVVTAALARLRRDCVEAKEALSDDTETHIPVALPGLHMRVRLNRSELEGMIAPALADTIAATQRALRAARVNPIDVRTILLTGGSSRIPLVSQMISAELHVPATVDPHPAHSAAIGAARATAPDWATAQDWVAGPMPGSPVAGPPVSGVPSSGPPVSGLPSSGPPASGPPLSEPTGSGPTQPMAPPSDDVPTAPIRFAHGGPYAGPTGPADRGPGGPPGPPPGPGRGAMGVPPKRRLAGAVRASSLRSRLLAGGLFVVLLAAVIVVAGELGSRAGRETPSGGGSTGSPSPSPTPSPSAAACVEDSFDGDAVETSWEKVQPRDGGFVVAAGAVELTAKNGSDIYVKELRAPMLLRVPGGDFTIETDVTASPKQYYQGAGLLLWNGSASYVRLERGYGDQGAIIFEYRDGGKHVKVRRPAQLQPRQHPHRRDPGAAPADQGRERR